jgi:predicted AlkP superfamily phosphohydrolase/phosphomutase
MAIINAKPRVFCIGLDGGTWSILRPLMEAGHMPNLKALAETGVSGVLNSTMPPITPAAWSTFMTGCNPGKHGIFDFQGYDRHRQEPFIVNATYLRAPTLWRILSEHGLRVAVVDLPMTYPPPRINGVLISGLTTPNRQSVFTQPESLRYEIERHLGCPWLLLQEEEERRVLHADLDKFLDLMRRLVHSRGEATLYLLQREPWDFAFVQFQCVDFLQHPFWKFLDPAHPDFSKPQYQQVVTGFFEPLDAMLGRLFAAVDQYMGEETLRVVVSDHGFQRHHTRVELNHWLYENGFLVPETAPVNSWHFWREWIRRLDVLQLRKRWLGKSTREALARQLNQQMIDRRHSVAWAFSSFWGYLYFGSRATKDDIRRLETSLHNWRDSGTGGKIVRHIYHANTIYTGDHLQHLPDMIIEPMPGFTFASKTYFRSRKIFKPVPADDFHTGTHAREGIYLLAGPNVCQINNGHIPTTASLQDLAPTLLHWLNLPIPQQMDGTVQADWFDGKLHHRAPKYTQYDFDLDAATALSESEQRDIKARLHTLGYL